MFKYSRFQYVQAGYAVLTMSLGIFFVLIGTIKLSPVLNEKAYKDMRKLFIRHALVFPLSDITGFKPNPHWFRQIIGVTEVTSGFMLAVFPGSVKDKVCMLLLVLLGGALHGHHYLGDGIERASPALCFVLLICTRLVLSAGLRSPFFLKHFCHVDISQFIVNQDSQNTAEQDASENSPSGSERVAPACETSKKSD